MDNDQKISAMKNKDEGKGKASVDAVENNKDEQITHIRYKPITEEKEKETFEITSGTAENVKNKSYDCLSQVYFWNCFYRKHFKNCKASK